MTEERFSNMYQDSEFLTAFDLMNQGVLEVEIERIEKNNDLEIQGRKVDKPVVYFKGAKKGWVASKTKLMECIMRYKPNAKKPSDLVGAKIKLMCDMKAKNPAYPGGKGPAIVVV